ncbi:biotin-dependent carboxyltransferase family protein [Dactylosporangium sp. CA-233914]|uniref:5-oxoprolinase subunit C family protein n=1 Tax=Dactylosporangium sp. CA-233914 TaxID=3239934 RepID=UPI003D945658
MTATLRVIKGGWAAVTDLGRYGHTHIGIQSNGAVDQLAARTANILVGNADGAPVIENLMLGEFEFETTATVLLAVTGSGALTIDGSDSPMYAPLVTWPGAQVRLVPLNTGLRAYVAVRGIMRGECFLGSLATDPIVGVGQMLSGGDEVSVDDPHVPETPFLPLFRPAVIPPRYSNDPTLDIMPGPEAEEFPELFDELGDLVLEVGARSDHVGVRLEGREFTRTSSSEILSRGVPMGAVEVPPTGGAIVLLRGRPITAGYPVVAVVTRACHALLGQLRPGDRVRLRTVPASEALRSLTAQESQLNELRTRCQTMYQSCQRIPMAAACRSVVNQDDGAKWPAG